MMSAVINNRVFRPTSANFGGTMKIIIELKFTGKISDEIKQEYAESLVDDFSETMEGEPDVWTDIEGGQGAIKKYVIVEER